MPDTLCRRGNLDTDASTCVVHGGTFGRTCDAHSGVLRHIDALTAAVPYIESAVSGWNGYNGDDLMPAVVKSLAILRGEQ